MGRRMGDSYLISKMNSIQKQQQSPQSMEQKILQQEISNLLMKSSQFLIGQRNCLPMSKHLHHLLLLWVLQSSKMLLQTAITWPHPTCKCLTLVKLIFVGEETEFLWPSPNSPYSFFPQPHRLPSNSLSTNKKQQN